MNRSLAMTAGALAVIGLIVNVAVDLDNVYDMTTSVLWALTLLLALTGAFLGSKRSVG